MTEGAAETSDAGVSTLEHQASTTESSTPPAGRARRPRRGYVRMAVCVVVLIPVVGYGLLLCGAFNNASPEITDEEIERLKAESQKSRPLFGQDRLSATRAAAVGTSVLIGNSSFASLTAAEAISQRDAKLREAIVGEWELPEDGVYRLALRTDNTGTMVYKPNGLNKAALFTSRLEIDITWSLKAGHVDMKSVSGKPSYAFNVAIASRGKRKYYRIDGLTDETLVLHELKKRKTDNWSRVR